MKKSGSAKKAREALKRKALGYESTEVVEEYGVCDGGMELTKRKVTKKEIPPDLSAIKAYLELEDEREEFDDMTIEELLVERERLLKELKAEK